MFQMQVGKAYFELVDYLEADRAFSLARQASPYSLEGMDIYSTVLYVSFDHIVLEERILFSPVKWKGGLSQLLKGCNLKIYFLGWVT